MSEFSLSERRLEYSHSLERGSLLTEGIRSVVLEVSSTEHMGQNLFSQCLHDDSNQRREKQRLLRPFAAAYSAGKLEAGIQIQVAEISSLLSFFLPQTDLSYFSSHHALLCWFCIEFETEFLSSSDYPGTLYIDQAGL